jgi:hypothetical protein
MVFLFTAALAAPIAVAEPMYDITDGSQRGMPRAVGAGRLTHDPVLFIDTERTAEGPAQRAEHAATIYATGQLLIPGDPSIPPGQPGHDDSRQNFVYQIDTSTGVATPVSPMTTGLPAALAGTLDQRLLGFATGQLVQIDPLTGARTPIGSNNGLNATGLEILPDNRGFLTPFDASFNTQQLFGIDIATGAASPISLSATAIGDAIDAAAGNPPGTTNPFIIGLGAVGRTLYGVDLDTNSLVALDSKTGKASVVGKVGAVGAVGGGLYSGFAGLTGVDQNADGRFGSLFGNVNFFDHDNDPATPVQRLGGVARYDLTDGTWSLVGTNPGVIFFGFGASPAAVPEPSSLVSEAVQLREDTADAAIGVRAKKSLLKELDDAVRDLERGGRFLDSEGRRGEHKARDKFRSALDDIGDYASELRKLVRSRLVAADVAVPLLKAADQLRRQINRVLASSLEHGGHKHAHNR